MKGPQRVQAALRKLGVEIEVVELEASTRTAQLSSSSSPATAAPTRRGSRRYWARAA
jgi:uncharacterized protein